MGRITTQRVLAFVAATTLVTIILYNLQSRIETRRAERLAQEAKERAEQVAKIEKEAADFKRKQKRAAAEERRMEEEERAEEAARVAAEQEEAGRRLKRLQFINQYVNTNIVRISGKHLVAVAVSGDDQTMNHGLAAALVKRFQGDKLHLVNSFFKPPLVSDGLFDEVFSGSASRLNDLGITNSVDALLLARQQVTYSTNNSLNNIITANMRLEIASVPVGGPLESRGWTFIANGSGFRNADARQQAEERILKQMSDKTNMSLGLTGN